MEECIVADRELNGQYEGWKKTMTDYQYKHLLELIEKVDRLSHENDTLRKENSELKERLASLKKEPEKLRTTEDQ